MRFFLLFNLLILVKDVWSKFWSTKISSNYFQHIKCGVNLTMESPLKKRRSENKQQIYRRHPCRSVISIKFLSNFNEITLRHGFYPINLLRIFRTPFSRNTSGRLLLNFFKALQYIQQYLISYSYKYQGNILVNTKVLN